MNPLLPPHEQTARTLPTVYTAWLEEHFYALINRQADIERLLHDPEFLRNPTDHPAFFADHGVVHVRDVARQVLQTFDRIHGVLIPLRPVERFEGFMKHYGVALAYLHDVGMVDTTDFGRIMHPEFASHLVFSPQFDPLLDALWQEDSGGIISRLRGLAADDLLDEPGRTLRELLALCCAHSKSKLPISVLNDRAALRAHMLHILSHDLFTLYQQQTGQALAAPSAGAQSRLRENLARCYDHFPDEAYRWLIADDPALVELTEDVIDTLRSLRCADALRQRGSVLKTSAGYEVFVDSETAEATYAIRRGNAQLFLVREHNIVSMGEANLASSELGYDGSLRISFHRGRFATPAAFTRAADAAAALVDDIQQDILESFERRDTTGCEKSYQEMHILIEDVHDSIDFAPQVRDALLRRRPALAGRVQVAPSLADAAPFEVARYLVGEPPPDDPAFRAEVLRQIGASGHNSAHMLAEEAFRHVCQISLRAGDTLVRAGTPAGFVYIPLGDGLMVQPLGGYAPFAARPWMPIGSTGVIRGALRNGTVVAEAPLSLLMIPKTIYLRHWYHPYTMDEFRQRLQEPDLEGVRLYALRRLRTELPPELVYHSLAHTADEVVPIADMLAAHEDITGEALLLLRTAAWLHDLGFVEARQDHEAIGARIAGEVLPGFGYTPEQIAIVQRLIAATKIPSNAETTLQQILTDSDLDVLGREDFMPRNAALRQELAAVGQIFSDADWYRSQIAFLRRHRYFTASARALRDAAKADNLAQLEALLAAAVGSDG